MSERVQVIFRWDKDKLERLKAWAASERLTLQEVLETLATRFLDSPDCSLIIDDSKSDTELIADLITRLEQVEKTVAPIPEKMAAIETELGKCNA
jgi:hypothetical protein